MAMPDTWGITINDGGQYNSVDKTIEYLWYDPLGHLGDQIVTYEITIPEDAPIGTSFDLTDESFNAIFDYFVEGTIDKEITVTVLNSYFAA